jgi:hypothetical protein
MTDEREVGYSKYIVQQIKCGRNSDSGSFCSILPAFHLNSILFSGVKNQTLRF